MITICLATYNGEKYLKEQIESLLHQTYQDFTILALDDCSTDATVEILKSYNIKTLENKKNIGANSSFSTLLHYALEHTKSDYFMFCDQDDIWEKEKIEKEYTLMKKQESLYPKTPILIHTDLEVVDENLKTIKKSFFNYQNLNPNLIEIHNLLVQNIITGCTIMLNRELAILSSPIPKEAIMHDWWLGLVATSFGKIFFIPETTIKYRQHSSNEVGAKGFNLNYIIKKAYESDSLTTNTNQAKKFLDTYEKRLTLKEKDLLEHFIFLPKNSFISKRVLLFRYKFYKHGFIRNIGLFLKI